MESSVGHILKKVISYKLLIQMENSFLVTAFGKGLIRYLAVAHVNVSLIIFEEFSFSIPSDR